MTKLTIDYFKFNDKINEIYNRLRRLRKADGFYDFWNTDLLIELAEIVLGIIKAHIEVKKGFDNEEFQKRLNLRSGFIKDQLLKPE